MTEIHKNGIIKQIHDNELKIHILSCSTCASCAAKNFCGASERKEKEIIIKTNDAYNYHTGEEVVITIDEKKHTKTRANLKSLRE